jgi:hypothetical protein
LLFRVVVFLSGGIYYLVVYRLANDERDMRQKTIL